MNEEFQKLFSLEGKVIVVTGAAGLLGIKHVESIAACGGTPILLDLPNTDVERIAEDLCKKFNVNAKAYTVNITDENEVSKNSQLIIEQFGKIDCLVNNAANNPKIEDSDNLNFSRLENFQMDIWNKDISVGLTGAFLCAKYYGTKIAENPTGGVIINISSDLGLMAPDQRLYQVENLPKDLQPVKPVTYSVVKSGLIGLTRYLATYWIDQNVRCNALCPGGVENGQPKEFIADVSSRIPMNRMAKADEYQGVLIWMLSQASSYLNGAVVPVDGGRTAW